MNRTDSFLYRIARGRLPLILLVCVVMLGVAAAWAMAQPAASPPATATTPPATGAAATNGGAEGGGGENVTLWDLFRQSFDLFTILLVVGSLYAWTVIIMAFIDVRESNILPPESSQMIRQLGSAGQWGQVRQFVAEDDAFVSRVVNAAMSRPAEDREGVREVAELAASEECARWFRKIEPLNIVGNLGPLLGLAGTVYGMVIAFAALGQAGGEASPANLSLGVSKALFHTLLGLMLAVPALTVFGFYRTKVDRLCTRAMVVASELVEMLPVGMQWGDARRSDGQVGAVPQPRPMPAAAPVRPGTVGR